MTIPSETPDMTTKRICNTCQGTGIVKGLHNWDSGGTREEKCRNCHEAPKPSPTPQADSQPAPTNTRQIAECYGDCPTDPKTCANPCKFEGRAARAPADSVLEDAAEPDMFWNYDDPECFGYDIEDVISEYAPGDIVKIDCAKRLPTIRVRVVANGDDLTYEIIGAPQADSQPAHQRDTAHLDEEIKLLADALDAAQADSVLEDAASAGFFLRLPQRPKPEAPAGTVGLDWDAYSGAQMLAYGRDCSNAAIVATQKQGGL